MFEGDQRDPAMPHPVRESDGPADGLRVQVPTQSVELRRLRNDKARQRY